MAHLGRWDNDASMSGILRLYNPSSTTFVKHYVSAFKAWRMVNNAGYNSITTGYLNTTSAVNNMRFQCNFW